MKKFNHIRAMQLSDLSTVKHIIDDNEMFPSEFLDEMTTSYFQNASEELWFVMENDNNNIIAVAYCAPEKMTEGTWNLLLIAVFKQYQGKGLAVN